VLDRERGTIVGQGDDPRVLDRERGTIVGQGDDSPVLDRERRTIVAGPACGSAKEAGRSRTT
jgi:hypothetical protein